MEDHSCCGNTNRDQPRILAQDGRNPGLTDDSRQAAEVRMRGSMSLVGHTQARQCISLRSLRAEPWLSKLKSTGRRPVQSRESSRFFNRTVHVAAALPPDLSTSAVGGDRLSRLTLKSLRSVGHLQVRNTKVLSGLRENLPYYAVRHGYHPGVYEDLDTALHETRGFSNNDWRRFETYDDARQYVYGDQDSEDEDSEDENSEDEDGYWSEASSKHYTLSCDWDYLLVCRAPRAGSVLKHRFSGLSVRSAVEPITGQVLQEFDGASRNNGYDNQSAGAGAVLWYWNYDQWYPVCQ